MMYKEYFEKKVPFYTLYPTQSNWVKSQNHNLFFENLKNFTNSTSSISMYLHFPFCPKQCYFCHCYTVISKKKGHFDKISLSIYKELEHLFKNINNKNLKITDVHFGGGTPTVMSLEYFEKISGIIKDNVDKKYLKEIALEVDPRNDMSADKLINYSNYGVNRLSIGIQDFEDEVQKAINRINSYDLIKNLLNSKVRKTYKSINFDFIFGLPKQTLKSLVNTTKKIIELKPTRITLLNMDHRPDIYRHQKAYDEKDLPSNKLKLKMYNMCSEILSSSNYNKIGVNHFALDDDILSKYKSEKKLYRNPNGFSPGWAYDMISVGPSATGKLGNYYYQNVYSIDKYIETVSNGLFPVSREKTLTSEDKKRGKIIMDLLNFQEISVNELSNLGLNEDNIMQSLNHFCKKGFLEFNKKENIYKVSRLGNYFVNHICNIFDEYNRNQYQSQREFNDGLRSLDRNLNLNSISE